MLFKFRMIFVFLILQGFTHLAYSQTEKEFDDQRWKVGIFTFANLPNKMQVFIFNTGTSENQNYAEFKDKYLNIPGFGVKYAVDTLLFDLEIGTELYYLHDNNFTILTDNPKLFLEGKNDTFVWLADIDWALTQSVDPIVPYVTLAFGIANIHTKTTLSSPTTQNHIAHDGSNFAASTQLGLGFNYLQLRDLIDLSLSYNYTQFDDYTLETKLPEQTTSENLSLKNQTRFGSGNNHQIRLALSYQLK